MSTAIRTNIFLDPSTKRIVYLSTGSEFPVKAMVIDDGKLTLFSQNSVAKIVSTAELPRELNAQNCWEFQLQVNPDKSLSVFPVKSAQPKSNDVSIVQIGLAVEDRALVS
jgi:hypothetical protein